MPIFFVDMEMRPGPSVQRQPYVRIAQWRFSRLSDGNVALLGCPLSTSSVRVTSPVVSVKGRDVVTSSGRHYLLLGDPTENEAVLLGMVAMLISSGQRFVDVTEEILKAAHDEGSGWMNPHVH